MLQDFCFHDTRWIRGGNKILPSIAAHKTHNGGIEKKKELASYSVFFFTMGKLDRPTLSKNTEREVLH